MSEVKITPLARRLAEENGIEWRQIKGTGPDGAVVERDILAFLAKVMAGEVNLPPTPEEVAPPAGAIPDMAQAQAVLQKEGVQLGDLVPSSPSAPPPPASALPTLEDIEFDLDLEPPSSTNKLIWETQEVLTAPEVPAPAPEPLAPGMSFTNAPEARSAEPAVPPTPEHQAPVEAAATPLIPPAASIPTPFADTGLGVGFTPSTQMLRVQAWQRLVAIGPAQEAAQTLSEAWRMEVGLDALLYRAADKALADTQTPLRPTKGQLEGNELKSLRVAPAQSLRGTLDSLRMASDPAEGLVVLSLADSAFDQVIFPGLSTLTLGRASGGHALLTLSGDMNSELAGQLLERVAYYLERPILLA